MSDPLTRVRTRRTSAQGREAIETAALRAFFDRGFHGTSIRDIAALADITAPTLYHHYENKQDLLRVLMTRIMRDALATTRSGLVHAGAGAPAQLAALVTAWVEFHAERRIEARVGLTELQSLEEGGRRLVVALRDEQEQMFRDVVQRGADDGVFRTPHVREAARAVVNMGTAVAMWFRPDGAVSPSALAQTYVDLALATVECRTPALD